MMRHTTWLLATIFVSALVTACSEDGGTSAPTSATGGSGASGTSGGGGGGTAGSGGTGTGGSAGTGGAPGCGEEPFPATDGLFWDDFEAGTVGDGPDKSDNGVEWRSSTRTQISTDRAVSGTNSLRFRFPAGPAPEDDAFSEQRLFFGDDYPEIWLRYELWWPSDYDLGTVSGADNNKFLRIWKGDETDGNNGYGSAYIKTGASTRRQDSCTDGASCTDAYVFIELGAESHPTGPYSNEGVPDPCCAQTLAMQGKWSTIVWRFKVNTDASSPSGRTTLWIDGQKSADRVDWSFCPDAGCDSPNNAWRFMYLLGWMNDAFAAETDTYVDDFEIATSGVFGACE